MKINIKEFGLKLLALSVDNCFFYNKTTGEFERSNRKRKNSNDFDYYELEDDLNLIALPPKNEIWDYGIIKDFMFVQEDKEIHDAIYDAIHGKNVFRKFRDVVERFGLWEKWYEFNKDEYEYIIKEWCEENLLEWE